MEELVFGFLSAKEGKYILNFQLIRPYLDKMKDVNPHSVMGCTVNGANSEIMEIHFFPGHCRDVLKCVRPLISLDAAHLKSDHMGMLYVATVLSGGNDIYPIGFMISTGNEDMATWTRMLGYLKEAFPIIDPPAGQSDGNKFFFISDRDKGKKVHCRRFFRITRKQVVRSISRRILKNDLGRRFLHG